MATIAMIGVALSCGLAQAAEHFGCHRISGGDAAPAVTIAIDYTTKTVEISPDNWFYPMEDSIEITDKTVRWGFMRGGATFDRQTHIFDWDARSEWDYLDYIGQTPTVPVDEYHGVMQCEPVK
jgi:hypothetical protein